MGREPPRDFSRKIQNGINSLLGALNPEETSGTRIRNSQLSTPTYGY